MAYDHILVPTDFSTHAGQAVETAVELAESFGSMLHLVHAYAFDVPTTYIPGDSAAFLNPQEILDPLRARGLELMNWVVKDLSKRGIPVQSEVKLGHASEIILAEAERIPADIIVMGTRGLTGLKHVVLGSTAERVVRRAVCPVLTVKSPDAVDAD